MDASHPMIGDWPSAKLPNYKATNGYQTPDNSVHFPGHFPFNWSQMTATWKQNGKMTAVDTWIDLMRRFHPDPHQTTFNVNESRWRSSIADRLLIDCRLNSIQINSIRRDLIDFKCLKRHLFNGQAIYRTIKLCSN